ncbi:MAG TPA: 4a-hydroxytetrahydrobiopterin dehydratase [Bacteroidia bacterium]
MKALSPEEIKKQLAATDGWKAGDNFIYKDFMFKNFSENFAFMTRVAMIAEALNHHPDWSGGYKNLRINLSTHDAGGISGLDFKFAEQVNKLLR